MIPHLSIYNFGSNHRIEIDFDPYVTCLTGESYTGKSWVVRALKWIALNRPSGIRFIRWGSKKSVVQAQFGKHVIKRVRSKTKNLYYLDRRKLEAFGNNVPDHIRRIINLSELNFQIQQEMPHGEGPLFWFALTPGQVSKRLNTIVNLDVIDQTLGNLQAQVHKAKTLRELCQDRYRQAREEVKVLPPVGKIASEWREVEDARRRAAILLPKIEGLSSLLQAAEQYQTLVQRNQKRIRQIDRELSEIETLHDAIMKTRRHQEDLTELMEEAQRLESKIQEGKKSLEQSKRLYQKVFGDRCPLCGNRQTAK